MKRFGCLAIVVLMGIATVVAQTNSGQVCIKAFEDRNANGTIDAGEPFITKDIGVSLAKADGVITSTALLDDSQTASSGIVCFSQLAQGQYSLQVASAAYNATTSATFVTVVTDTSIPQVFDFGAQVISTQVQVVNPPTSGTVTPGQARYVLEKIFVAGMASALVIAIMTVLGAILFFVFVRQAPAPVAANYAPRPQYTNPDSGFFSVRPDTGAMPAIRPDTGPLFSVRPDTSAMPPIRPDMDVVRPSRPMVPIEPPASEDDTDRFKPKP